MRKILTIFVLLATFSIVQARDVIDTLVVYTKSAKDIYGSDAKIKAEIKNQIDTANLAFRRSGLNVRINPILVNSTKNRKELAIKSISGKYDSLKEMKKFIKINSSYKKLKKKYNPDITIVYRRQSIKDKNLLGEAGYILGYKYDGQYMDDIKDRAKKFKSNYNKYYNKYKNNAFVFLNMKKGISSRNTAHEIGHILGLMHPKDLVNSQINKICKEKKAKDMSECTSSLNKKAKGYYPYSRGYAIQNKFITIMGYPTKYNVSKAKLLFSSPDILKCKGEACGIDKFDRNNGADAVSTIKDTARILANFHRSKIISSRKEKRIKAKILKELRAIVKQYKAEKNIYKKNIYLQRIYNKGCNLKNTNLIHIS